MFVRLISFALSGIDALPITVEVDVSPGIPSFDLVGLPDAAVREARERVRAAIRNGGWAFPTQRITVNLAPAHTRKGGASFDLAIAVGILGASGVVPPSSLERLAFTGELALDGSIRKVSGVLAMALTARRESYLALVVPASCAPEGALGGGTVLGASHLGELVDHLNGHQCLASVTAPYEAVPRVQAGPDFEDVKGQLVARRAMEIAAAGGHNVLLMGPPGAGKSLLARCLPGILPPLTKSEAFEVSRIHSVAGTLTEGRLMETRPYRAPHHCASRAAILGGGAPLRPGEITLAHGGVLFLDELPEFRREVLEGLRQPLEEGQVIIARAHGTITYPARPMLVAAANPCPCGYLGDDTRPCSCPSAAVTLYRSRLSGPLLDRFDMQIFLSPVRYDHWGATSPQNLPENSRSVRLRVELAHKRQLARFEGVDQRCNAHMTVSQMRRYCRLPEGADQVMRQAIERLGLSLRGHDRVVKLARTIADLAASPNIEIAHLTEALQYRSLDRRLA
jgi:magnesium chelatase family protein